MHWTRRLTVYLANGNLPAHVHVFALLATFRNKFTDIVKSFSNKNRTRPVHLLACPLDKHFPVYLNITHECLDEVMLDFIDPTRLEEGSTIGHGTFGVVKKGRLRDRDGVWREVRMFEM